jgi:hypothetical protein
MAVKSRRRAKNVFDSSSSSFSRSSHCSKVAVALFCAGVLFNSKNGAVLRLVSAYGPGGGSSGGTSGGSSTCTNPTVTTFPTKASLRQDNGCTTKAGVEEYYGKTYTHEITGSAVPTNAHIYNSFEAGFSSSQDGVISGWGCSDPSKLYDSAGGLDLGLAESKVRKECYDSGRYSFPNINATSNVYTGAVGPCGGHTGDYHFHGRYHCLYSQSGTHSTSVGDVGPYKMYGKWEDYTNAKLPLLDACGAHFGTNPDSPSTSVYHYHVQDRAPYGVGCYGPSANGATGATGLVTVAQCRALYSECGDGSETFTDYPQPDGTKKTFAYDRDCPCFDANGLNTGTITERPAIAQYPTISFDNSTWTCGDGVSCMQTVEETIQYASTATTGTTNTTTTTSSSAGFCTFSTLAATILAAFSIASL